MKFLSKALAITWKDIVSEFRAREIVVSVLVFTLLVIVTFNFAFGSTRQTIDLAAAGMLWVTFSFAGVLSLTRSFILEKEEGCLEGMKLSPISAETIYIGKLLSSLVFMMVIEIIALPIFAFLFNLNILTPEILVITFLTTLGFCSCGTLFSALAVKTKARELVLPILFLPIVVPIIIGAVKSTGLALSGASWQDIAGWLQIIGAFDVIFLVISYLIFNFVIEE